MNILLLLFLFVVAVILMAYGLAHLNSNKKPDKANVLPKSDNTSEGDRIGYVPKDMTKEVRNNTQLPCPCFCYIGCNDGTYFSECYITIHE